MEKRSEEKRRYWQEQVDRWVASGQSARRWCGENQVNYNTFLYWKDQFPASLAKVSFVELPTDGVAGIELNCQGVQISLTKDFDPLTLARCLAVLRGQP